MIIPKPSLINNTLQQLPNMLLQLELVINGLSTQQIISVTYQHGHYIVPWTSFRHTVLNNNASLRSHINHNVITLDSIPDITVNYDSAKQQLLLTVPIDWLPRQQYSSSLTDKTFTQAHAGSGLLVNYDLYSNYYQKQWSHALWSEEKIFNPLGNFTNSGVLSHDTQQHFYYQREASQWNYNDETHALSYYAGDVITAGLPWSNSVRMGGIQIARNFSLRPDLITYPLPEFSGQARLPSTVDLYIDNYKSNHYSVSLGPFTLSGLPYMSGANQAVLTIQEPNGYISQQTFSFYTANNLLRPGLADFSMTTGLLRNSTNNGLNDYRNWAFSSFIRYGVNDDLTANARVEGGSDLLTAGIGTDWKLADLGVVSGAVNHSLANRQAFVPSAQSTALNSPWTTGRTMEHHL